MKKILIVDDEPDVGQTMKMLVERSGYAADWVSDPREGLKMVKGYDLLLLDIMMPRISGRAFLAEMKKQKISTPVIVVSAVGLPQEIGAELAKEYPGVDFIAKTEMHTDLIKAVAEKIGK